MARKGQFGRSGTTQNLSLLVYSLLKEQMNNEIDGIMTAYKTNMESGKYSSQFNGQNVDGEYVMNYYSSMLSGYPSGSTEYQTLKSQMDAFSQRYQSDIQNLVINAMNNGTQIDYGLLGEGFENKGVSDVSLVDVKSWADKRVAFLESEGMTLDADKLKGAVFVAGVQIELDGKVAAQARGDISNMAVAKFIKSKMAEALDNGLTKDSEPYRQLESAYSRSYSAGVDERKADNVDKINNSIDAAMNPLNDAAKSIINGYINSNGTFAQKVSDLILTAGGSELVYFNVLNELIAGDDEATLKDLMNYGNNELIGNGKGDLQDLLANASLEAARDIKNLDQKDIRNVPTGYLAGLQGKVARSLALSQGFARRLSDFGGLSVGLDNLAGDLTTAGMSTSYDPKTNRTQMIGGQPDAVFEALGKLKDSIGNVKSATWLNDLADGFLPEGMADSNLAGADGLGGGSKDNRISFDEIAAWVATGQISSDQFQAIQDKLNVAASNLYLPNTGIGGGLDSVSIINAAINAAFNKGKLSIADSNGNPMWAMVVKPNGMVEISDDPFKGGGASQAIPIHMQVGGKTVVAYAQPAKIYIDQTGQPNSEWPSNGMKVSIYRMPGNTLVNGSQTIVSIKGKFKQPDGTTIEETRQLPLATFREYLEKNGIPTDDLAGFNNDQAFGVVITEGALKEMVNGDFLQSMWLDTGKNPNSVWSVSGASNLDVATTYGMGSLGDQSLQQKLITTAFSDVAGIQARATELAGGKPITRENLRQAIYEKMPKYYDGLNTQLLKDTLFDSAQFKDKFKELFPAFVFNSPTGGTLPPTTGYTGTGSTINTPGINIDWNPGGGTGIPKGPDVKPGPSGFNIPKPSTAAKPKPGYVGFGAPQGGSSSKPGVDPNNFVGTVFRRMTGLDIQGPDLDKIKPPKIG